MAITAYFMPRIYGPTIKQKLRTPLMKSTLLLLIVLVSAAPFGFAF
ncbi:MAG: hypothetical protein ACRDYA_21225 [Egibacteraceae bacterium]